MVRPISFAYALAMTVVICGISYAGDSNNPISPPQAQQGSAIAPVKLNLAGKEPAKVYIGSYLVNAIGDCSGCHSFPQYLQQAQQAGSNPAASDPIEGTPSTQSVSRQLVANFNTSHYLAGGQCFGPFMARNLTPEANGLPVGLTEGDSSK